MTCAKCKAPLPGGAVFCPDCGEPVPGGTQTVQLPTPGTSYGGTPTQSTSAPSTGAYPPPQGYQPPPSMQPPQPAQHYGPQQGHPQAGWVQPGPPGMAAHTQPQPGYAAPGYTPSQRKSDPLLVVMGVLFILVGLVPLVWVFLLRAPMGQWIWLRQFLDSFYFVDSNRFVGSACVLLLLGVPGVILLIKGLRR